MKRIFKIIYFRPRITRITYNKRAKESHAAFWVFNLFDNILQWLILAGCIYWSKRNERENLSFKTVKRVIYAFLWQLLLKINVSFITRSSFRVAVAPLIITEALCVVHVAAPDITPSPITSTPSTFSGFIIYLNLFSRSKYCSFKHDSFR